MNRQDVERIYRMVSSEYNRTPLGTEEGWIHTPTEFELREMLAVARCLRRRVRYWISELGEESVLVLQESLERKSTRLIPCIPEACRR